MRERLANKENALDLLIKGKEDGLCYFFNQHYTPLCYFVDKLVDDTAIAEEITADTFIRLWNKRQELTPNGSIKALLYQIARNAAIDHLRKQKRMAVHEEGLHYLTPTPQKTILQNLIETETIQQIVTTLQSLPPKCSEVFKLSYLLGKTDKEIACQLKLSPHTVRNQKLRAIRILKEKIAPLLIFILLSIFPGQ